MAELTRRSFLKTSALAAGALAVSGAAGCSSVDTTGEAGAGDKAGTSQVEEKTYINTCRGNCGGTCPLVGTVREGKIVKVLPLTAPDDAREAQTGCLKGIATPQRIYSPSRVLHPMKQTGERGSDNWEQITWDEAFELIAQKFQAAIDEYGASSVAFWHSFGSTGFLSQSTSGYYCSDARPASKSGVAMERFVQKTGATVLSPSSDMTGLYMQFNVVGYPMNAMEDLVNAKTILIWGSNPCEAMRSAWQYIAEAHDKGATVITIDPHYTASAAHSDLWVPIRVGTDAAMMLGMANYIIDNDLIDYDYLRNGSVAPLLVKDDGTYLTLSEAGLELADGEDTQVVYDEAANAFGSSFSVVDPAVEGEWDVNGIHVRTAYSIVKEQIKGFTVEFAARECGIDESMIVETAKAYAQGPSSINNYWGMEHTANSYHDYVCMPLLASLTGNINKEGASILQMASYASSNVKPVGDPSCIALADAKPGWQITGEFLPEIMNTGKYGDADIAIRCVYVMNANPLSSGMGRTALMEAFDKVDFTVVADSFMTDTARHASLVLPIALSWECEDMHASAGFMMQKAIEPLGECLNDMAVFRGIAAAMGYDDLYLETDEEYLRAYLDTEDNKAAGVGYDDLHEKGLVENWSVNSGVGAETNATGRTQFYLGQFATRDRVSDQSVELKDRIPYYEHAAEAYPGNPLQEKYPLYGFSCHDNYKGHSLFPHVGWLDELQEPYIKIHTEAAAARGIATGDTVRVFNDCGSVVLKAVVTEGIQKESILYPHGWYEDEYIEGHAQSLVPLALDKFTSNNNYNDLLCEVEKYEGGAER